MMRFSRLIFAVAIVAAFMFPALSWAQVFRTVCENGVCRVVEIEQPTFDSTPQATTFCSLGGQTTFASLGCANGNCAVPTGTTVYRTTYTTAPIATGPVRRVFQRRPIRGLFGRLRCR